MRKLLLLILLVAAIKTQAQTGVSKDAKGLISGNLLDVSEQPISGATVELIPLTERSERRTLLTSKEGQFSFPSVPFGYYRLYFSFVGLQSVTIDSIHVRAERYDFNLTDVQLKSIASEQLNEVVVYAEKPLIQSKDGNITFNASESALSAGSNASDLLKSVPLVAADPDGKLTIRGKEPRILIDEKPVELNAQQLQDLLESMPGGMIERIEVMTNPPPQYANEEGGVINIVTRKGRLGLGGRVYVNAGSRGEKGTGFNVNARKKGMAVNLNGGYSANTFNGNGYSNRQNLFTDSTTYFNSTNRYRNINRRPHLRLSFDYDITPRHIINFVVQYNQNGYVNTSSNQFQNLDAAKNLYRYSVRSNSTEGQNVNPSFNFSYTFRGKKPGTTLKIFTGGHYSDQQNDRNFFQEYLTVSGERTGNDSIQRQFNDTRNHGIYARLQFDKLLDNKKTSFSTGAAWNYNSDHVIVNTDFLKKPENVYQSNELLSNEFVFRQTVGNLRFSARQIISKGFNVTAGVTAEFTNIFFDLFKLASNTSNKYVTPLPFLNLSRTWEDIVNLSLSYRKTIRRPGMGQLNPSIDYGDPYNLRFGNPYLAPSTSHNFDLVLGRTNKKYYVNLGLGYNVVQDAFSQIRRLVDDGKTEVTWQNLDDRIEYQVNSWAGYTVSQKFRLNFSASYTKNQYSLFDRTFNRYRDGESFSSSLNTNYSIKDLWNFNSNFAYNRFANPQGTVRSNVHMNIALQRKLLNKKFIVTLNLTDPILQQKNFSTTYAQNFIIDSYSSTRTRNYKISLSYNFQRKLI